MKIPEEKYKSSVLRGKDLQDSEIVKITEVGNVTFNKGKENEREAVSITVKNGTVSGAFTPNMKNLKVLVDALGDETDEWIDAEIRITPVPAQTPDGKPTTGIAIGIPKGGKK